MKEYVPGKREALWEFHPPWGLHLLVATGSFGRSTWTRHAGKVMMSQHLILFCLKLNNLSS